MYSPTETGGVFCLPKVSFIASSLLVEAQSFISSRYAQRCPCSANHFKTCSVLSICPTPSLRTHFGTMCGHEDGLRERSNSREIRQAFLCTHDGKYVEFSERKTKPGGKGEVQMR